MNSISSTFVFASSRSGLRNIQSKSISCLWLYSWYSSEYSCGKLVVHNFLEIIAIGEKCSGRVLINLDIISSPVTAFLSKRVRVECSETCLGIISFVDHQFQLLKNNNDGLIVRGLAEAAGGFSVTFCGSGIVFGDWTCPKHSITCEREKKRKFCTKVSLFSNFIVAQMFRIRAFVGVQRFQGHHAEYMLSALCLA